jgi:hypothetical protein
MLQSDGNIPVHFKPKTLWLCHQLGQLCLLCFSESQGVLLAHFQKHGENENSASYCEVLWKLWNIICRKLPGKLGRVGTATL